MTEWFLCDRVPNNYQFLDSWHRSLFKVSHQIKSNNLKREYNPDNKIRMHSYLILKIYFQVISMLYLAKISNTTDIHKNTNHLVKDKLSVIDADTPCVYIAVCGMPFHIYGLI